MNNQNKIVLILMTGLIALVLLLSYLTANRWLKHQAVDSCLKAGKHTISTQDENGGKYTNEEPMQYWYETCMKEKGLMRK